MGFPLVSHRPLVNANRTYDIAVAGGGLAGLSLSIQLARKGFRVCLFEKETYPFHKVCGEYISMESWDFLIRLGLPLENWNLPKIHQLFITAPNGESIIASLPLGGFGISRYKLDAALAGIAKSAGVDLFENSKVFDILFEEGYHRIQTSSGEFTSGVACACSPNARRSDKKHSPPSDRGRDMVGISVERTRHRRRGCRRKALTQLYQPGRSIAISYNNPCDGTPRRRPPGLQAV